MVNHSENEKGGSATREKERGERACEQAGGRVDARSYRFCSRVARDKGRITCFVRNKLWKTYGRQQNNSPVFTHTHGGGGGGGLKQKLKQKLK